MDKVNIKELKDQFIELLHKVNRYKVISFIVFVLLIYGFIFYRISNLYNQQPSQNTVQAQISPLQKAGVDKQVVSQLKSLRDNSVNVQSLFSQSRSNPFQECPLGKPTC